MYSNSADLGWLDFAKSVFARIGHRSYFAGTLRRSDSIQSADYDAMSSTSKAMELLGDCFP